MRRFSVTLWGTVVLLGTTMTAAAHSQPAPRTLFDQLEAVGVHVVGVGPAVDSFGVDSVTIRVGIEERLRREGLSIRDSEQLLRAQETPRLVVHLAGFPVESGFFYSVILELLEPVRLDRSGVRIYAYGWSHQVIGLADAEQVRPAIDQAVDRLTGLFVEGRRRALALASR